MSQTQWRSKRLGQLLVDLSLTSPFLRRGRTTTQPVFFCAPQPGHGEPCWLPSCGYSWPGRVPLTSSHPLGFCRLCSHRNCNYNSISTVLCFVSVLGRLHVIDYFLTFSSVDSQLRLKQGSFPQVSSRASSLTASLPRIAANASPVP